MKASQILETADLSIFKEHPENRETNEKHVGDVLESLKVCNLFDIRPILVDADMCVLDGQHRVEAAKRLGIPVKYQIVTDPNANKLIFILNAKAQRKWTREDYLHYHCALGNEHYQKLRAFMKGKGLSLSMSLTVLGPSNSGERFRHFREGKFEYPLSDDSIDEVFAKAVQVVNLIEQKVASRGHYRYIRGPHFQRALLSFLGQPGVNIDVFLAKVSHNLQRIRACATLTEYNRLFVSMYNWKNANPLPIDISAAD